MNLRGTAPFYQNDFTSFCRRIVSKFKQGSTALKLEGITLYLICQFWALPIQQKNMMSKTSTNRVELSDLVEFIAEKGEIAR